jgi:hypothetical protein
MEKTIELDNEIESLKPVSNRSMRMLTTALSIVLVGYGAITARDYATNAYQDYRRQVVREELAAMSAREFTVDKKVSTRKLSLDRASYEQAASLLLQAQTDADYCHGKVENALGILKYGY